MISTLSSNRQQFPQGFVTDLSEAAADGAGLLDAEVKGLELLALVQLAEVGPGLLVDDGKDASDRLANGATERLRGRGVGVGGCGDG